MGRMRRTLPLDAFAATHASQLARAVKLGRKERCARRVKGSRLTRALRRSLCGKARAKEGKEEGAAKAEDDEGKAGSASRVQAADMSARPPVLTVGISPPRCEGSLCRRVLQRGSSASRLPLSVPIASLLLPTSLTLSDAPFFAGSRSKQFGKSSLCI